MISVAFMVDTNRKPVDLTQEATTLINQLITGTKPMVVANEAAVEKDTKEEAGR